MSQVEHFGFDSIEKLLGIVGSPPKNIFLVTGRKSFQTSGAEEKLNRLLKRYSTVRFDHFSNNPLIQDVLKGISLLKEKDRDWVIAVGGGSVLDMAKLINIFSAQGGAPLEYIKGNKKIKSKGKPLLAIPTTAGTGSEATHFAAVYVDQRKYSVAHPSILPDASILDPKLTMSLSPYLTATTGFDALCQAIESYWNIHSTEESKRYAREAIALVLKNLTVAVKNPTPQSRDAMLRAANFAGKAINITKTTAPHAVSYPITLRHGVPHGHAVALTLPAFLVFNNAVTDQDVKDPRGSFYVRETIKEIAAMLECKNAIEASKKITSLMQETGLKTHLSDFGIATYQAIDALIQESDPERMSNHPRLITKQNLEHLLRQL